MTKSVRRTRNGGFTGFMRTRAQIAAQEKTDRERQRDDRFMSNLLGCWRVCPTPRCRRLHDCAGDASACFQRHWRALVPETQFLIRETLLARRDGLDPKAAMRAAEAKLAAQRALMAKFDPAPAPVPQRMEPPAQPRIRHI